MSPFGPREAKLSSSHIVGLTELGKRTAEQVLAKGPSFAILSCLAEHSPRSVHDIADETGIEVSELKERVKILARQGYVRLVGGE